jgi:polyphenol oxidase
VPLIERDRDGVVWLEAFGRDWRVAFSTRHGGVSSPPYADLDLSHLVGDVPERVRVNRARLTAALGLDTADLVVAAQVHGTHVRVVGDEERGKGAFDPDTALPGTDGLVTDVAGLALMVSVADCVPVLVVGERPDGGSRVALVHAGWRGMAAGIVTEAARIAAQGAVLRAAVVGPSIGPCCFAVSPDVGSLFDGQAPGSFKAGRVDLWRVAGDQLRAAGVPVAAIDTARVCTSCDERFFSHRRDGGLTGRQAAIAWVVDRGDARQDGGGT